MFTTQQIDLLNTTFSQSIASASNPEEAARLFAKLATAAIGQALANALQDVVSQVSSVQSLSAPSANIQGWESFITGAALCIEWPSPNLQPCSVLPVLHFVPTSPAGTLHPAGVDVSIGISISGRF
ncbi:hypothetical protein [Pseudomonas sp. TE50-2]|uniref:hypothetical protein n=1 Tax=Pseudomonas sp. TE50-2 TaxID=3142707 RepID=UPI0034665604